MVVNAVKRAEWQKTACDATRSSSNPEVERSGATTLPADAWEVPWFCIQTKPGKHFIAASVIHHRFQFPVHCPMRVVRRTRTEIVREQLFPGYLFVQFDVADDRWVSLKWQPGVQKLLTTPSYRPLALPAGFVSDLLKHREFEAPRATAPVIRVGDRVELNDQRMAGQQGIVNLSARERVEVLMQIMGGTVRVIVNANDLVVLEDMA